MSTSGSRAALFWIAAIVVSATAIFFATPSATAHAAGASLYVSPATGTFTVGSTFTVSVYVNTGGQSVNAVDANLSFPPDKLQVVSPDSGKSLIQIWTGQPSYSNSVGTLNFQGAIPTPGINTGAGLISTITFRVMQTGTASLEFDDSRVLLNDGYGTDALTQTTDGVYALTLPPPAGPAVMSPTDPDQAQWYDSNTALLQWATSSDIQGFSYAIDDNPVGVPDEISEGMRTSVTYDDLPDGIQYFHIRALRNGEWGGITTYVLMIDTSPPAAFSIDVSPSVETSDQHPVFSFETTDPVSGVDYYELKIIPLTPQVAGATSGTMPFFIEENSPYTQALDYGDYDVYVRAYDNAGNYIQEVQRISITTSIFEVIGSTGIRFWTLIVPWPYAGAIGFVILFLLCWFLWRAWRRHEEIEEILRVGAMSHPDIAAQVAALHGKRKEYGQHMKAIIIAFAVATSLLTMSGLSRAAHVAFAATDGATAAEASVTAVTAVDQALSLDPPIINLAPSSIANDQILYLGGWANMPNAQVLIHIEKTETGETFTGDATTGSDGNWFYSSPQLLDSGHYVAWAELTFDNQTSAPSARTDILVEPTALAIGNTRLDYQDIYLILFLLFCVIAILLLILLIHATRTVNAKRAKLEEALRDAEESLRRGFAVLRRDIELELATIGKAKLKGTLSEEEKDREDKLMRDLEDVSSYVGKEIWRAEEEGKSL